MPEAPHILSSMTNLTAQGTESKPLFFGADVPIAKSKVSGVACDIGFHFHNALRQETEAHQDCVCSLAKLIGHTDSSFLNYEQLCSVWNIIHNPLMDTKDIGNKKKERANIPRKNDKDNLERDIMMKEKEDKKHRSCKNSLVYLSLQLMIRSHLVKVILSRSRAKSWTTPPSRVTTTKTSRSLQSRSSMRTFCSKECSSLDTSFRLSLQTSLQISTSLSLGVKLTSSSACAQVQWFDFHSLPLQTTGTGRR